MYSCSLFITCLFLKVGAGTNPPVLIAADTYGKMA